MRAKFRRTKGRKRKRERERERGKERDIRKEKGMTDVEQRAREKRNKSGSARRWQRAQKVI